MMNLVEYKKIVSKISIPADQKIKQKAYSQSGALPVIDQGQEFIGGYTNDCQKQIVCDLPVIVFGDHTKNVKYINIPFCAGADGIKILKAKDDVFPKYLYYGTIFLTYCIEDKGYARHYQHIEKQELSVPPLPEQERIVAKIEELFSQLDSAVAELKSVKEKLAIYRQAVLSAAWNSVSGAPMKKTEDICFFITKGTTPPKSALLSKGEVPFLKVYNLTFDNTLDFSIDPTFVSRETHENFLARSKVLPGDVLMNIVGPPLGKVSIVPQLYSEWNINQAIARFRCSEEISNSYLAYFLGSATTVEKIKNKAKATAGQFNLTLEICRNIDIPVPTLDEQLKIVQEIEEKLSVCNNIEQTVDTALQQAAALRQSILKQAFEGNL